MYICVTYEICALKCCPVQSGTDTQTTDGEFGRKAFTYLQRRHTEILQECTIPVLHMSSCIGQVLPLFPRVPRHTQQSSFCSIQEVLSMVANDL